MERAPPEKVTSDSAKLEDASESAKLRDAVSPAFREATSELMAMVGGVPAMLELLMAAVLLSDAASQPPKS